MNNKTLNIKLPARLYEEIKAEAKKKNISLAAFVRLVLTENLEKIEKL